MSSEVNVVTTNKFVLLKKFLGNKKAVKISIAILVFLLVTLVGGGIYIYSKYYSPIGTVKNEKITRADYNEAIEHSKKVADFSHNSSYGDSANVKKRLVEEKLVKIIAEENNIIVTDKEVEEKIKNVYKDPTIDTSEVYEGAFGYNGGELKERARLTLLKDKIKDQLLVDKKGRFMFFRFNSNNSVEEIMNIKSEELNDWAFGKATEIKNKLDSGVSFDKVFDEVEKDGKNPAYASRFFELNQDTPDDIDSAERAAFSKLKVGEYSDIIKTETYYAIYKLDKESNGKYSTWEDLINDYTNKYVKLSISTDSQFKIVEAKKNIIALLKSNRFISKAFAACSACSGCSGSRLSGTVSDSVDSSIKISGATVKLKNAGDMCEGSSSGSVTGYCGYSNRTDTTDSNGYYNHPRTDGYACFANCGSTSSWYIDVKVTNWTDDLDINVNSLIVNGSSNTKNVSLAPHYHSITVGRRTNSQGYVTGWGISCGNGGTDCSQSYTFNSDNTSITATAFSGNRFIGWDVANDGDIDYTTNPLTFNHDADWTIYAVFVDRNILTTAVDPVGAGTVTGAGTYDSTATVSATATANQGYQFERFDLVNTDNAADVFTSATVNPAPGLNNPASIGMNKNWTLTARFRAITPTCSISASPTSINSCSPTSETTSGACPTGQLGQINYQRNFTCPAGTSSSTLTFSSTNATSGTINNGVGSVGTSGTRSVSPGSSTTYTYSVSGGGGSTTCSATVSATSTGSWGGWYETSRTCYVPACSINSFSATSGGTTSTTSLSIPRNSSVTFNLGGASYASTTSFNNGDTTAGSNSTETTHQFRNNGIYTARYSCTGAGGNGSRTINITVADTCSITSATATPDAANPSRYVPLSVAFNGSASSTYASPLQYQWTYAPSILSGWLNSAGINYSYTSVGTFTPVFAVRVNDGFGTSCGTRNLSAITTVERPYLTCEITPASGQSPLTVKVDWRTNSTPTPPTIYMDYDNPTDKQAQTSKPNPFFYTYQNPGSYRIHASNSLEADCVVKLEGSQTTDRLTVTSPNNGTGGEVKPR